MSKSGWCLACQRQHSSEGTGQSRYRQQRPGCEAQWESTLLLMRGEVWGGSEEEGEGVMMAGEF